MEQIYNNSVLHVLQAVTQNQQAIALTPKGEENISFQKMMKQKQQPIKEEGALADTSKTETEVELETKTQEEEYGQGVLLAQEMVWAQMIVMDGSTVTNHNTPVVETSSVVLGTALQSTPIPVKSEIPVLEQPVVTSEPQVISMEAGVQPQTKVQQPNPQQAKTEVSALTGSEQAQTADGNTSEAQMEQPKESTFAARKSESDMEVESAAFGQNQVLFRDVESVPIKVGEATPAESAGQMPEVDKQLADQMVRAIETGESKVEIHLTPESLGVVTVEITRQENGALCVVLNAESLQTRGLLEKHAPNLQALLSAANQETVQVEIPARQESHQQNFYDGRNGNSQDGHQQQEQHQHNHSERGEDFLQQLRLGLVSLDSQVS